MSQPRHVRSRSCKRNCIALHGREYVLRIKERLVPELAPRTKRHAVCGSATTLPLECESFAPRCRYLPIGSMTLGVLHAGSSYELMKVADTASSTVEAKLPALVARLGEAALRRKVEDDMYSERVRERERLSSEWQSRKDRKDQLMRTLSNFEEMSKNLDRAESLRRLRQKLEACSGERSHAYADLELLVRLADWLDPTTHTSWPEIDDVPDRNPYASYSG